MNTYKQQRGDGGFFIHCSWCDSTTETKKVDEYGDDVNLCPFCYETGLGLSIHHRHADANISKSIAQSMNLLLKQLRETA